jgi:hypothetical protein
VETLVSSRVEIRDFDCEEVEGVSGASGSAVRLARGNFPSMVEPARQWTKSRRSEIPL